MKLKHRKETHIVVEYGDLERFIKEVYGHEFQSVAEEEWSNDSAYPFNVDGQIDEDSIKLIEHFMATGFTRMEKYWGLHTSDLLNDLARRGLIETGKYLINVYW